MTALELLLHPIWTLSWHWGLGIFLIIACIAGAIFSPIGKKFFIITAVIVFAVLSAYAVGIFDADKLTVAKQQVVTHKVNKAVRSTRTVKARKAVDPWDQRSY